jgi:hypothetical protein
LGEWTSKENITRLKMMGWCQIPSLMIRDVPQEDHALLALADSTEQVVAED